MNLLRIIHLLLLISLLLLTTSSPAQTASDLTLRLFYAHTVHAITLTPIHATLRDCPTCPAKSITSPIEITASNNQLQIKNAPSATTLSIDGTLRITSPADNSSPLHAESTGHWRITADHNELRIQLTLPSERYVMAALAAESAPDEPLESLRALAIVIRTYALENLHRHRAQGFDLCDSTHCQALRLAPVRPAILEAVNSTAGETLYYHSQRATVYFTQNCGGQTESALAAWGKNVPYLNTHPDPYCPRRDLAQWHNSIPLSDLIAVLRANGFHPPRVITGARVLQRTASGRAALIEFTGNAAPFRISANSLRFALDRSLGWQQIRSDGYDLVIQGGTKVLFTGRGYGHGVGLCQAGAYQMASTGSNAADILNFYFPGTNIRITPHDSGWHTTPANGWQLKSTDVAAATAAILKAGNRAQTRAQQLFPASSIQLPLVTLAPDTELFRQLTISPGWMLAVTIGNHIYLQPYSVIRRTSLEDLLLHEMLHARIEQVATPKAPLWLREGLIEALIEPTSKSNFVHDLKIAEMESALANPVTQQQSQRAHLAAAQLVRNCIQHYGLASVFDWLTTGVPPAVESATAFNR